MKHDNEPTYRNTITKSCRITKNWQNLGTLLHHQSVWNSNKIPTVYFNMTRFFTFQIVSSYWHHRFFTPLTLAWRRSLWYRNESIDLLCKSMDWLLYDREVRHERVKHSFSHSPESYTFRTEWLGMRPTFELLVFRAKSHLLFGIC